MDKTYKIGVLGCGFECDENIHGVLRPWIEAKNKKLANCEFVFSFVYGQFKEYAEMYGVKEARAPDWYQQYKNDIDFFFTPPPLIESESRNVALNALLQEGCDLIWILDLQDEFYTLENIENIINFVSLDRFTSYFKISLKNFVFNKNTYLVEPFQPPRIWRTETNGYKLERVYHDNDFSYIGTVVQHNAFKNKRVTDKELPCKTIPKNVAFVRHETWLDNSKSRAKVEYQTTRGWNCSYKWNYEKNCLEFNEQFYKATSQPIPQVLQDNT